MKTTWFITGISRGFGKILAEELLLQGCVVIGTTRNEADFENKNLHVLKLDVTRVKDVAETWEKALKISPKIDVVVNNAGFGIVGAIEEIGLDDAKSVLETNFFGTLNVIQAALPTLRKQRSGNIVNFFSQGGFSGLPGFGIYNASKFAVEGLSEALAEEVKPLGIDVMIVEPGAFRTDFLTNKSLVQAEKIIEDYKPSAGKMRDYAEERNGHQPGDPQAAMRVLIQAVNDKEPSLRLPLGADCLERMKMKIESVQKDMSRWETASRNTAYSK
jgi:NAD(P)-dependent dehydrogenase (short-subunit alcohol dehydrogenase family)